MANPYTHGVWTVKQGQEDDFVRLWTDFAKWSKTAVPGALWAKLLRDREHANRFITVGPWQSLEDIERWRSEPGWRERIGGVRELLVGFEPSTLDVVAEID